MSQKQWQSVLSEYSVGILGYDDLSVSLLEAKT